MTETFGQRFQRLRKKANLTQEDVAAKLNITAQAVSKWENDISAPDISVLAELSDLLHVTLDELLGKAPAATVVPTEARKDFDKMFLKVRVLTDDGDKVNVNLPLAVARVLVESGVPLNVSGGDKNLLECIDFKQIFALVEQGVIGKIVEVHSADGDHVEIWVE